MIGKLVAAIAMLAAIVSSGCATMFSSNSQQVNISSQPPGARVTLNGAYSGVTPLSLTLKTEQNYQVVVQREGYRDATATIHRDLNPVAILNLVSIVCWAVDLATGAFWRLEPTGVQVTLQPGTMMPGGAVWPAGPPPPPGDGWSPPPPPPGAPPGPAPAPPPGYPPSSPSAPPGVPPGGASPGYPPPAVPSNPP